MSFKKSNHNTYEIYIALILFLISNLIFAEENNLIIRKIIFEGNNSFSSKQLKNVILLKEGSPVDRTIINDDANRIINYYHSNNKYMVKLNTPSIIPVMSGDKKSNQYADVFFQIEEIDEPTIHKIKFKGNIYFSSEKLKELLNITEPFDLTIDEVKDIQINLTELYLNRGFLFAETNLIGIFSNKDDKNRLIAEIEIKEGKIVTARNFIYKGNKITRESIIAKYSSISEGQILTPQALTIASKRLESKPYIKNAYIIPVDENSLLFDIEESNMTRISALLGYSNSKNIKNKFNGFINADFLNLMGTDRDIYFSWKQYQNDFSSVKLQYHESGHNYSPLAADLSLYREEGDSTYTNTKLGFDVYYQGWSGQYFTSQKIGLSTELNELFPGSRRPKIVEKQTDKKIGIFWYIDMTDDYYNPTNGWEINIRQYKHFISKDKKSSNRYSTEFTLQNFYPIKKNIILSNKLNFKYIENKSLTYYDLYKVGGTFSIRGFLEDTFSGDTVFWSNTEIRFLLTKFSRIFLFADYAYIEDNRTSINNKFDDLLGLGFGLRADTKIGILLLNYAFSHSQGEWNNPLSGIIHFGIETNF